MLNARPEGRCQAPQPRSGAPKAQGLIAALRPQHNPPCRRSRSPAASPPADRFESVARAHLLAAALMPAEPHIRSSFTERLAPQSLTGGVAPSRAAFVSGAICGLAKL